MRMPAFFAGDSIARLLQGAAAGAALTVAVGFIWGGWVTGGTALKNTNESTRAAVVKIMAPECVRRFQAQVDMTAQ